MNSKKKAKELVDKMLYCYQGSLDEYTAKQCALICCNELLEHCYEVMKPFWQEVKKEIEKL